MAVLPEEELPAQPGANPPAPGLPGTVPGPIWARSSTAAVRAAPSPAAATLAENSLPEAAELPVVKPVIVWPTPPVPPAPLPTTQSPDGRFLLTDTSLTVLSQTFGLRELEHAEVQRVRWVLWVLLGGLGLAGVLILFLQNRLHTLPAMVGLVATAGLLAYGQRGTNRLRLWLLGRPAAHFGLPGELAPWQRLVAELNRRVARAHDRAAAEAAYVLALAEAERAAQAAAQAPPNATSPTSFT